jgi:hypothetical protein
LQARTAAKRSIGNSRTLHDSRDFDDFTIVKVDNAVEGIMVMSDSETCRLCAPATKDP